MEWANEPMEMRSFPTPSFTHVVFGDMDPDDMPEMDPDGMMMLPDEDDDVSYNVLHFCSAACLSDWSGQAAALD